MNFEELFISESKPYKGKSKRDKFLSRLFGIFNEEIIRIWCENRNSPFDDLGRPTIYDSDGRHYTLDFLLKDKDGCVFLTEMKCEIEYQKYKFLTLADSKQFNHHRARRAFQLFLEISESPRKYVIKCAGSEVNISGTALVWGRISDVGEDCVKKDFLLNHVISTEQVVADLVGWEDDNFREFIEQYSDWSNQLFDGLLRHRSA